MKPTFTVHVVTDTETPAPVIEQAMGFGSGASETVIKGRPMEITIARDGEPEVGIHVTETGRLIITAYGGHYTMGVPQNLSLEPGRPWTKRRGKR